MYLICWLQDHLEPVIAESKELNQASKNPTSMFVSGDDGVIATISGNDKALLLVTVKQTFNLTKTVKHVYRKDKPYPKILEKLPYSVVKMV